MMSDRDIEQRLAALRDHWRVAKEPPLDRMWERIESEAFPAEPRRFPARWIRTILPLAATLTLGFGIGQFAPRLFGPSPAASTDLAGTLDQRPPVMNVSAQEPPFVGVATDYLERVTALLVTLAAGTQDGKALEYSATQARDLLATTRLLMDAPQRPGPHLHGLLEDLELVLAQIARLPARPDGPDVYLIDQAMDQRDVIPRLREYLAEHSTSQP
jgi:hypothetical protein